MAVIVEIKFIKNFSAVKAKFRQLDNSKNPPVKIRHIIRQWCKNAILWMYTIWFFIFLDQDGWLLSPFKKQVYRHL